MSRASPELTVPWAIAMIGLGLGLGSLLLIYLIERYVLSVPYPPGVQLVREPVGARRFSLRTRLAYYTDCESLYREAYENYVKQGRPVLVPGIGFRKEVIMPSNSLRWVLAQPDSELDVSRALADMNLLRWSLGSDDLTIDAWHGDLVRTEVNRVLENTCAAMNDELCHVFDEYFGTDTENWKEIDLESTMNMIIAQAASRFTVGLPLCRNKEYLKTLLQLNNLLLMNAGVVGAMPNILQPVVGRVFNLSTQLKVRKMRNWLQPLWEQRIETLKFSRDNSVHVEPQDHVQLMVRYAAKERPEELQNYDLITARICAQNFGAVHQTGVQVTNLILNILGSDAEFNTIAVLREEANNMLSADINSNGEDGLPVKWTKAKVNQLTKADSVCRETLRLNSMGSRAVMRKVLVDNFRTNTGQQLPKGTIISFLTQPVHTDAGILDDPFEYDPFRYSRFREDAIGPDDKSSPVNFVTTSPEFMPFGHGKHACPGRFLVDFEFKMILAYVLRNYDLKFPDEYRGRRPHNVWMTEALFPPAGVKVLVKRRML